MLMMGWFCGLAEQQHSSKLMKTLTGFALTSVSHIHACMYRVDAIHLQHPARMVDTAG